MGQPGREGSASLGNQKEGNPGVIQNMLCYLSFS